MWHERERRRQHVMLMKAVEARKKAEERERLRQEKRDEKRLNKERKLEQRRLELEIARELKKPNEDMCLSDHKFLRGFGKVLGLDLNTDVPTLGMLQEGLLNVGDSMGHVQDLLVKLLSLAVCDPGLPPGQKTKTMLGDHLTNVGINRDNVSEVLQMYMGAHCANTDLAPLALSLKTKAFQAHTPAQKASILGFLANELACSKAVISEIDKGLDQMANMRKDKIIMEGKLKKLRTIYAKRTGKREASMGQHHQTRRKLFEISHSLRSMMYGQDRYRRRYWVLPHCGGVFIEAMESGEETVKVEDKENPHMRQNGSTPNTTASVTSSSPTHNTSEPAVAATPSMVTTNDSTNIPPPASTSLSVPCLPAPRESPGNTPPTSSPAPSPHLSFQANDQLLRVLTERSGHWFSLLPRNPCDLSSITTTPPGAPRVSPQASSTPARPRSPPPSPALPLTPSAASASASPHHPAGLLNYPIALQVKPGGSLLGVSFASWPSGMMSPSLPLCSSPSPMPGHSLEGNTAASVSSKSESPLPRIEKSSSMPSPTLEMPKSLDHPAPRPIPEEMLTGWWRVSDIEELRALVNALHSRGVREKGLQRQMQKYMEIIPQVSVESVRGWCVEEQAMEMDIAVLQQVEELERKVTAASLQVKGWTYPDPQSEREDLVYYEHKPPTKLMASSANAGEKDSRDSREHPRSGGRRAG
ncbi:hypothetical protein INR49_026756 [Caranx melampygus]|nr:hypothetical protein INR49_026756 [Caranx melampygus]